MKSIHFLFGILFLLFALTACQDDDVTPENTDYLIFGHYYGFCVGETCIETYKLENEQLFEDNNDGYAGSQPFNFVVLHNDIYEKAKELTNNVPSFLTREPDQTFGCPDCGDWGGLLIEIKQKGETKRWHLDQMKSGLPTELYDIADEVNLAIERINE